MKRNKFDLPKPSKPRYSSFVDRSGKLSEFLNPAAFCDTSSLLDYYESEIHNPDYKKLPWNKEDSVTIKFREYLRTNQRSKKIYKIREAIENSCNEINLVFSTACRLELEEVFTEIAFKRYGVEVSDVKNLQKKSKKEIGDIINRIRIDRNSNENDLDLYNLYQNFFFMTIDSTELLSGLYEVDLVNIRITKNDIYRLGFLANLQIGFADIFHLISAQRLGCKYFFTLDKDFERASSEIERIFKFKIVSDIDRMISVVKTKCSS